MNKEKYILSKAKNSGLWICLPEASQSEKVVLAGLSVVKKKICNIIFLGDDKLNKYACDKIKIINPKTFNKKEEMINFLFELRKEKGLTNKQAKLLLNDNSYFAVMLLKMGLCDGVVNGAITPSKDVIKPALQIIKGAKGISTVSSCFLMLNKKKNFVFADCGLLENPTSEQLCDVSIASALSCEKILGEKAKVGFLSFSTLGSGKGEDVDKVKNAVSLLKRKKVNFDFDGEFQADAALSLNVAKIKAPKSKIAGLCNTLIFPSLDAGNIGYKLYQQASSCKAIGPVLQGLAKPVNDLSRGANVDEIVLQIAVSVLQHKDY